MNIISSIFYFCIVLGILVFIHELGHLVAAKKFGVYCKEFAIGMGPTVIKLKKPHWETTYSIRALPLGGFVAMAGEPGEEFVDVPFERTIGGIKPWKRLIVMLAGIFMNLVLAIVIYIGYFNANGQVVLPAAKVETLIENSAAEKAGLQVGDTITALVFDDGTKTQISTIQDLQIGIAVYQDRPVTLIVDRNGEEKEMTLKPQFDEDTGSYLIGIQVPASTLQPVSFFESIPLAFSKVGSEIASMIFLLSRIFRGIGTESLGGPVAIFGVTSEIGTYGFNYFLQLLAMLSINLAVINLLPIPVMDGGRVVLTLIEMIFKKPLPEKIENAIMTASVLLLLAFFIFVTYKDILKLF